MSSDSFELPDGRVLLVRFESLQYFVVCHDVMIFIIIDADTKSDVLGSTGCPLFVFIDEVDDLGPMNVPMFVWLKKEGSTNEITVVNQGLVVV